VGVAIFGVVVSIYYYFNVIRSMYWPPNEGDASSSSIDPPPTLRWALYGCMAGMIWLGVLPNSIVNLAEVAAAALWP
jgi:NADH:ubiquinone oxidoreductase subunit 2 (subunit N)